MQVGIFISEYDSGGSHTRSFVKCLAERDILVDIFLCNPMGYKEVDTFSYGIDMVNVYYFQRDWNFKNRSDHLIIKSYVFILTDLRIRKIIYYTCKGLVKGFALISFWSGFL